MKSFALIAAACLTMLIGASGQNAHAAPAVSLTSPAAAANFGAPAKVTITATATPSSGTTISKVDFYRGTTLLGTDTSSPYSYTWNNVAIGNYSLTAKATDSKGAVTTSAAIAITVKTNVAPTVSITAPANNASYSAPASIVISANAADSDGTLAKVDFYRGTTLLGTDTTSPYTYTWSNVAAGSYSLTAKATDNSGGVTTSSAVAVTVTTATTTPPTVSLTAPASGASYVAPASITLAASASAAAGATISKVDFYNGATLLKSVTAAPYSYTWGNVATGNYSLTAKATDNKGATATSTAVSVTVTATAQTSVSITSPINNTTYSVGAVIPIVFSTTVASGKTITLIEYFLNSNSNGAYPPSTQLSFGPMAYPGSFTFLLKATDSGGTVVTSAPVTVTIVQPLSVSITSPVSGASYPASATIPITATAATSASGVTVSKVDFYSRGTLLGTATSAPYNFTWINASAGRQALTAVVTDSNGAKATSAPITVTVTGADGVDSCIAAPPLAANESPTKLADLSKLPMTFEANAGQTHAAVRFQARGAGYQFFLTDAERVLALQSQPSSRSLTKPGRDLPLSQFATHNTQDVAVRMRFIGANRNPLVTGVDPVEEKSNYLIGSDSAAWHTNVPHFAKVRYHDLYPGIDEVYYGTQGKLEYDLHVAPGANPRAIRFALGGVDKLSLNRNGDLLLKTALGTLVQKEPVAYQDIDGQRRPVKARYQIVAANEVTFKVGKYDTRYALVIDPVLVYSTYLGGTTQGTEANAIALSRCGEAFVAGWTKATDFPTTPTAYDTIGQSPPIGRMGFVSKLNQSGTALLYSTYFVGAAYDTEIYSIAVDNTGHAFVNAPDGGIAKLNRDGNALMYLANFPGMFGWIAVDAAGSAYMAGGSRVWKLDPTGTSLVYSIDIDVPGSTVDSQIASAQAIAVDSLGNAYVAGSTVSTALQVTPGAFQTVIPNPANIYTGLHTRSGFVKKINPSGTALVYGTYLGTAGALEIFGLALDSSGNVYVTGKSDFNLSIPNFTGSYKAFGLNSAVSGSTYAFVAKLSADGSQLGYFTRYGDGLNCTNAFTCFSAHTQGNAIALDQAGNIWITGPTGSNLTPLVRPLVSQFTSDYDDIFVAKLSSAGNNLLFSTILGGQTLAAKPPGVYAYPSTGNGIAVDAIGSAYVTGATDRSDFPTTVGAFQRSIGTSPGISAFVVKINENRDSNTVLTVTPMLGVVSSPVTLTASVTGNSPTGTVTFMEGASALGTVTLSGASATLTTSQFSAGSHYLAATYNGDTNNYPSTSVNVTINIADPNGLPSVTLTGIADGAAFVTNSGNTYTNANVTITANSATGNTLNTVYIYTGNVNPSNYWNLTTPPLVSSFYMVYPLGALAPNIYTVWAKASDSNGHTTSTLPVRFVVNTATATPATVSISAPANGASFIASSPITLTASAIPFGSSTINYVTFYDGPNQIGVAFSSPYTLIWNSATAGAHSLMAHAYGSGGWALSAPVTVTVTAPPPPSVSLTSPANGSAFYSPATIVLAANATAASGATIAKVDFYDGPTLLGTAITAPYTYTWTNVPAGNYAITAKATDSRGATATTTAVSVTVTAPPPPAISLTSPASGATFENTATIPLAATASTTSGTIAKIEFFDGATLVGTVNGTASALSATFNYANASVGSHAISAKATTSDGGVSTTPATPITVTAAVAVTITSPAAGAMINDNRVTVSGAFQAPANSGVVVNGVAAAVDGGGNFYAQVELIAGSNTLTAQVTTPAGATAVHSITVTANPAPASPVAITADQWQGLAPLTVTFTASGVTGTYTASVSNPGGTLDQSNPAVLFKINYTTPGVYQPTVTITDSLGATATKTFTIVVQDPAQLDQMLKATWSGMNDALLAGDKAAALRYLNVQAQAKYGPVFDVLMPYMPEIIASYSPLTSASISSGMGEFAIRRLNNGVYEIFLVYFLRDVDGVWRIDEM